MSSDRHPSRDGGMRGHRARRRSQGANLKRQVPMGLVVLKSGMSITEADLQQQLVNRIRDTIGAITCYKDTLILARLPKTRSGKMLRKTPAHIVNSKEYRVLSTIDDPGVIPEIIELLRSKKLVK